jgi:hypothetical protein
LNAALADNGSNKRLLADRYSQAFLNTSGDFRFTYFLGYGSMLSEGYCEFSRHDLVFLSGIVEDKGESSLLRAMAIALLGRRNWQKGNLPAATDKYREAIDLIDSTNAREREKTILVPRGSGGVFEYKIGAMLQEQQDTMEKFLNGLRTLQHP